MKKNVLKTIGFMLCLAAAVWLVAFVLCQNSDKERSYVQMTGFYDQEPNSLDVVFLGASDVYAYYQPALAWDEAGYTSWNFVNSGRAMEANLSLLKEARKTQPDALYVITLRRTVNSDSSHIHFTTDNMKLSKNKWKLANYLCDIGDEAESTQKDRLEYLFPLIRYHSRWESLTADDFKWDFPDVKGSANYELYLKQTKDCSGRVYDTDRVCKLTDEERKAMRQLLNYIEKENVNVLFLEMPRTYRKKNFETVASANAMGRMAEKRGFTVINLTHYRDEIGLDRATDYYNAYHTNVHGAIKVSRYLADYISSTYGFEDKREQAAYSSWDEAAERYKEIISGSLTETEKKELGIVKYKKYED